MMQVTRAVAVPGLGSEYEKFLFASIGAEENGTLLSVLSALARLDIDPWQEAASLAQLPGNAAIQRLASLIAAMPSGSSAPAEPATTAARLIALLPGRSLSGMPSRQALRGVGAMTKSQTVIYAILILTALVLGAEWFAATRPSSAPANFTHSSASGTNSQ